MLIYIGTVDQTFNRIGNIKVDLSVSPGQKFDHLDEFKNELLATGLFKEATKKTQNKKEEV